MADALERPERFCGMHFFNPVHRMPLVEVIRGSATDAVSIATVYAFALKLGKIPVVVGDGPGFLVNRILGPYLNEAGFLLGDGASVGQIDAQAKQFGMPMGPLRLIDEVGIDVSAHAGAIRKMFVHREYRGTNLAGRLLDAVFRFARSAGIESITLGTLSIFHAAHRFYEKSGFERIDADELPPDFPLMTLDDRFYQRRLSEGQSED
jgi:GNAT superfamily N-acetyltransferase